MASATATTVLAERGRDEQRDWAAAWDSSLGMALSSITMERVTRRHRGGGSGRMSSSFSNDLVRDCSNRGCRVDIYEINSLGTATGSASFSEENLSSLFDLFNVVLPKLSITKAEGLWHTAMKLFSHDKIYFKKLVKCATLSLSSAGGSDCGASVASAIVGWVLQKDGIKQARKMYKRSLALLRPSLKFFQFCIELEGNLASTGNHDALVTARKLFDSAMNHYPQERELWRKYYNMELKVGTSETSNAIYWRARKVLNDPSALHSP
ncbi:uncharacterized protein LOC124672712 [Lolium rigidum]|uniref:uncharacterized protein LOC124672712 n=1 Tax=Lolium rigidum TaxID=89674 RepID=UPI001F5D2274|nr:uncharacterized protein LOC124672712 [Lolium rigidum]